MRVLFILNYVGEIYANNVGRTWICLNSYCWYVEQKYMWNFENPSVFIEKVFYLKLCCFTKICSIIHESTYCKLCKPDCGNCLHPMRSSCPVTVRKSFQLCNDMWQSYLSCCLGTNSNCADHNAWVGKVISTTVTSTWHKRLTLVVAHTCINSAGYMTQRNKEPPPVC